jgi:hypothetical protein
VTTRAVTVNQMSGRRMRRRMTSIVEELDGGS